MGKFIKIMIIVPRYMLVTSKYLDSIIIIYDYTNIYIKDDDVHYRNQFYVLNFVYKGVQQSKTINEINSN